MKWLQFVAVLEHGLPVLHERMESWKLKLSPTLFSMCEKHQMSITEGYMMDIVHFAAGLQMHDHAY